MSFMNTEDSEQFCSFCLAGTESGEHHEQCESWTEEWEDKGFPTCDTCGQAAVFSEGFGNLHTYRRLPEGIIPRLDQSGHKVTMRKWSDAVDDRLRAL
jgi:hypothetical protein